MAMGDASIASRPNSSAVKNRDADKKRAALWKKQAKSFKLKDVGKKVDGVRFCAQDERFFREQTEVLPLLMGFLSRTKIPELVLETLTVMHTLLAPPTVTETTDPDLEVIHPEVNAGFMLERSMSADSAWKAGEPFINLYSMNALAPEIRSKAIEVYDLLLQASVALSASAGEATPALLQFQSVGSPCSALLGCLWVDNGDLQFTALSCLRTLLSNPPNEAFLGKFESEKGISRCLEFISHSERRYHRPALDIVESFSKFECGRGHLKKNNAASVLRKAIQEAQEMIQKTSTIVPVSGMDASPLSVKDAPLLCSNIGSICQAFVRMTLGKEQVKTSKPVQEILHYSRTPRATGAAAAAANAALANAAALAALLPFSIDRCVGVISSLGRMIEYSEQCKAHAKAKGLLPVLLDCFKVKEAHNLHQVADKLLHLCIHITDIPDSMNGIQDDVSKPQQEYRDAATPGISGENPPLVAVDAVLFLLETSYEAANTTLVFRHVRWFAALVDLPRNANALGERAVSLFLQVLATTSSSDKLLFAFLAKSIHAIVLQNSAALEWIDEYEEETAFESKPLTEILHNIDVWLAVAEALAALANAFLKWNPSDSGSTATDFSELMAAKLGSHQVSPGKPEIHATGGSTPSAVGEAVMLSLLEKGLQVPKLISQYTAVNPAVCVSLLGLLDNLMTVPSGMKVLLHLAKRELPPSTGDQTEDADTGDEWPLSVELSSQTEHAFLLLPILNVLQSPDTSFIEIEAAIQELVQNFITLAQVKQENIVTKYREKLELEQKKIDGATPAEQDVDLNLPYQTRWSKLLDHKFSVLRFGYVNYSALLLASELALSNVVSTLLSAGASSETASPEGLTPLMIAFLVGNEGMVIDLLDARANVDAITTDGQDLTVWNCDLCPSKGRGIYGHLPLHYACLGFCGNLDGSDGEAIEIIRLLLEQTAQYNTTASGGLTALHLAVKSDVNGNNLPVIDVLLSCSALNVNAVHEHILIDSLPIIPSGAQAIYLAEDDRKQAFVSSRSLDGKYHIILTEGQHVDNVAREQLQPAIAEVVKRLITQQANMRVHLPLRTSNCDLTAVDADTSTSIANRKHAAALHYAVMYDDFAMVEALLTSPGDHVLPNVRRSGDGFTPLHLACEMENMKIIKLLLDHGASLTQLSSMSAHGVSPLQLLMKFDTLENDKLKELISENYLRPEMLLDGATMYVTARPNSAVSDSSQQDATVKSGSEIQANDGDDGDATSCALLREEQHNFDLFERLQNLNRERRASHEALTRRLETELDKSDAVLRLFFDLLQQPIELKEAQSSHLEIFQQLRHCHECYRQYTTRSQWKRKGKILVLLASPCSKK
ncbi:Ankyrin repeat-containing domain [Phytophthora cactorum]|nr:Ankyrin repeat-containing domain [Phytophthora cactorum]